MRERWALFESPALGDEKFDVRSIDGVDELNQLFRFSTMQVSFGCNMLAIVDEVPRTLGLDQFISLWVKHQLEVIHRRTQWQLDEAERAVMRTHSFETFQILRDIAGFEDIARWARLSNELEVWLYNHPVNAAREAAGQRVINGAWLWGAGPRELRLPTPTGQIQADQPFARGLARQIAMPDHDARRRPGQNMYFILMDCVVSPLPTANFAAANFGGPKTMAGLFEKPNPSAGSPRLVRSKLLLPFSSWYSASA